jgi:ABC-type glycerol-3-phosphate transport system permease component
MSIPMLTDRRWVNGRSAGMMCLILWALAVLLPFAWTVLTAFKSEREMRTQPFGWPASLTANTQAPAPATNFTQAWHELHFAEYFRNSVSVVCVSLGLVLLVATPASYALARLRLPGRRLILIYLMSGMMIPAQLILVPLFFQYSQWSEWLSVLCAGPLRLFGYSRPVVSLHDSHLGLILIYVATSLSFSIFVLTSFFRSLPAELYEAGIMDGCTEWQVFRFVMLPVARSGVITVAIFNFISLWNEYLFALVFINDASLRTLPLGLAALSIQANYRTAARVDAGVLFAGLVIVMIPTLLVYMVLQKRLVRGITVGAVKG